LCGNDANVHTVAACSDTHCRKAANCWHLKGQLIDCCFRRSLKCDGYIFDKIARQLEMLFQLDFEQISYKSNSPQQKRSDIAAHMAENESARRCAHTAEQTEILFEFLNIFRIFKREMAACGMQLDGGDLQGMLQTLTHQLKPA
jgi:hypothetical protein